MLDWLKATGCIFALFLGVFALSTAAQAGPEDGRIVNGSGSISQSGTHTDIRQNSDFLATHWGSFNIAAHESVQAHQPGSTSRLLIRVDGGGATNIAGNYTSNGITILENQNGVQFSRGAIVNVGGLLATSSRISGAAGANWQLDGVGGAVVNHGQIAAGAGGVVLAAVRVENHGKITAQGGDVSLGAGSAFTVDFAGSLVGFEVKKAADGASVVHDGVIESQGGIVSLSAQEVQAVRTNVVSVGGVVKATRLERRGGVVYLSGGTQGIAEVSGDVSASRKVQTTGEYVVVKGSALLKAPEILVGGDFQGKGDVQTAKRTLVEAGALLDAGAGGRVIVWSDDVTWFNGNITAPGGFAEVSGKETLASVNLAGIDVGELLLDPADIIIAAAGTGDAVTADIAAADPGMTLTLDVATINTFAGALSLAASDTIMVDGEINKPTGNLTLIAGGVLTLGADITTSAGDLALTGASIELGGTITLTGGAITLTGAIGGTNNTFSAAASGVLTLNSNINTGTSDLTLAGGMGGIALGGDLLLNGGNVIITGAIAEAATSTDDLSIVALDDMTLNSDINLGMGTLTLRAGITSTTGDIGNGGTARQIMAGSLHLRTAAILSATLFTTTSRVGGAVEVRFGTAISPTFPADNWLFSLGQGDLSIRGIDGVTLGTLAVGSMTRSDGVVDLRATTITLGVAITGTAITLYADALTGSAVSLTATDGDIDLRTANGTANSAPSGSTFTSVTLRQNSAFGATAPLIFPATLNSLTLTTAAAQTVQGWMVATGRALSVTSGGVLTVNSNISTPDSLTLATTGTGSAGRIVLNSDIINLDPAADGSGGVLTLAAPGGINFTHANGLTLTALSVTLNGDVTSINLPFTATTITGVLTVEGDINTGTGNITLSGVNNIQLSADVTLTGGDVALTGSRVSGDNFDLRVVANGDITLNIRTSFGEINLGTGLFDLRAGGNIINAGTARAITAGDVFLQQTGAFADNLFATTGSSVSGSVSLRITTAGVSQTIHPWMAGLGNGDFSLAGVDGVRLDAITLATALTFTGEIDLRALGIFLTGTGALTGTVINLRADNVFQQNTGALVAIHATSGDITATRITDTGAAATGRPTLGGTTSFSLEQTTAFGALNTLPFTFVDGEITAITLVTRSAQAVQTWMVASGRTLSLTTSGVLTVGVSAISPNTGGLTGNLTLSGASIVSTNAAGLEITANDVTLTGDITLTGTGSADRRFLAVASGGGNLTLSGSIFAGASDITLDAVGSGEIILGGDVELRGGVIRLSDAVDGTTIMGGNHALSIFADGNIFLGGAIALGSGALTLSAGENGTGNISFGGGAPQREIAVGALTLRQVSVFGDTLFASGSTASGAVALRPRSAVIQQIQPWMTNLGDGAFSLRGVEGITLTAIIVGAAGLERTVGEVDLQATTISLGGNITGQNGITLIADTISFTADVELISSGNTSLTGAISGNQDLTLRADGDVILNNNINLGTGTLAFAAAVIRLGSDIELTGGTVTLSVTDMFDGSAINADLTINASVNLTLGRVNLGTGDLIVNNTSMNATTLTVPSTWTARNITLTGAIVDTNDNNLTIRASGLLTLNDDINLGTGNLDINAMGGTTLGGNVTLTAGGVTLRGAVDGTNGNHNFAVVATVGEINLFNNITLGTGDLTLDNSDAINTLNILINNENNAAPVEIILSARNITLASGAEIRSAPLGINSLSVRARENITISDGGFRGFAGLQLRADDDFNGTGTIINGGTAISILPQLGTPMNLLLQQAGPFAADLLTDLSQLGGGTADLRITNTGQTQAIHPWMELGGTSFTLRGNEGEGARAAVVLTAITIGETTLNYGTTDIDLQAAAITLSAATTLTGGAISLTGALTTATNNDLTITASGLLTLNNDITLGTGMAGGILTINAGDRINVPNSITITASANNIIFTDRLVQSDEAGFTPAGSTTSTFNNMIFVPPATSTFPPPPCPVGEADCSLGTGAALIVDPLLEASASITLNAGTNALSFSGEGAITITSPIISITAGSIDIGERSLTIMAAGAGGTITLVGVTSITGTGAGAVSLDAATIMGLSSALTVNVPSISIARNVAFGTAAPFTFGMAVTSLTIEVAAAQTVESWMVASGRSLDITTSNVLTVDTAITGFILGDAADLTLNGMGGITLTGSGAISLSARDITLSSEGNITFNRDFTLTAARDITLNGTFDGSANNRSFSATASGNIELLDTTINLGTGNLTLRAATIPANVVSGNNPAIVLTGGDIELTGSSFGILTVNRALQINANGNITLDVGNANINLGSGRLELNADADNSGMGAIIIVGARPITAGDVFLQQAGAFAETSLFAATGNQITGSVDLRLTTAVAVQNIYPWMASLGTGDFSLHGAGEVVLGRISLLASNIPMGFTRSAGAIDLRASGIVLGVPLTGTSVALRATSILGQNSQPVAIHATEGEITATRITATGGVSTSLPTALRDTPSLTLTQSDAFGSAALFTFEAAVLTSLTLTTDAVQDVYNWMIRDNINLTVTSALQVRVGDAIGAGNRNLGAGDLTLTSTGGAVRIFADISTTGNITLNGSTGINFNNRAAKTLSGAAITLSGNALSNRDLTLTASGVLTLNGDITATASNLVLTGGTGGIDLSGGARTISGVDITLMGVAASDANLTINASSALTLNNNITLTGSGLTLALRGAGAIVGVGTPELTASTVRLRQFAAFAEDAQFTFGSATGSLLLITDTNQEVHDWMIALDRNLTVRSSRRVRVMGAAIGPGLTGRDLGAGSLTLRSTGGVVRILENISTTGSLTLIGPGTIVGTDMPVLTASTVSLSQADAFAAARSFGLIADSLEFTTTVNQDVHNWMIRENTNLTVTSSNRVRVVAIIGTGGAAGRNLGNGSITLTSTGGAVRILANITTGGAITLSGGTGGINFNSGAGAKALSGAAITLTGVVVSNRALTITATDALRVENNITLTGTSSLTLMSATVVRIFADISTDGDITLSGGTIGINFNNRAAKTLSGAAIMLTGAAVSNRDLTLTVSGTLTLDSDITLTGAVLTLALSGAGALGDGSSSAVLTASTVRLRQVDEFAAAQSPFNFGATPSLELTTTANQDVHDWMIEPDRNLTLTSSRRVRVRMGAAIGSGNRDLGAGSLTLRSTGGIIRILADISTTGSLTLIGPGTIVGMGMPVLTASTVSLSQADAFAEDALFTFGSTTGSLELTTTTTVNQEVHNWMIALNRNLTVTSALQVRVGAAIGDGLDGRDLGTGSLTLTSTGGAVRIFENISTTGNITLNGATGINLNGGVGAKALSGAGITLTGVVVSNRALTITATDALRVENNITLTGTSSLTLMSATVVRIFADISTGGDITLSGGTIGINFNNRGAKTLSGRAITLTGAAVSNRDLTLIASGTLMLNSNIIATGTSALSLSGSSVSLGGALTLTGGDITLTGAATGSANLTLDASGTLTINNDITLTGAGSTLALSGAGAIVGVGRPLLTAGTVSFTQNAAFAAARSFGLIADSLEFTTTMNQDVHNWMIRENTNLTVTSSNRVRVLAAIGSGVTGRNLGTGSLTLTSTGRIVRIVADISTTGDVTITASSILTINNDINIGTGALILEATSFDFGSSVDLAAGSHSFTPILTCNTGTSPSCTVNTP